MTRIIVVYVRLVKSEKSNYIISFLNIIIMQLFFSLIGLPGA